MNYKIHLFLFCSLLILTGANNPDEIYKAIMEIIEKEKGNTPNGVHFHEGGFLGKTGYCVVWKGDYKGQIVALKVVAKENIYRNEIGAYSYLDALFNPEVEKHGIPNVYLHGDGIIEPYWTIGMTLLDETLYDRWIKQGEKISELSILLIFKQGVKILEYLYGKKILHNDIKPANIFLRGSEVFFADFNLAAEDGVPDQMQGGTTSFISSGFCLNKTRTPMDDLESLVFSLWYLAGIEWDTVGWFNKERQPEGKTLAECKKKGTAKSKMIEKCKGFRNADVQKAFERIAAQEMLKDKHTPDFKLLTKILDEAIKKVHGGKSGEPKFEWLTGESSRSATVRGSPVSSQSFHTAEYNSS